MQLDVMLRSGGGKGHRIQLDPEVVTIIGRVPGGIHLADPLVSLRHAEIAFDAKQKIWTVRDLGSVTGTFLDGRPVPPEAIVLRPGQTLRVGQSDIEVLNRAHSQAFQILVMAAPTLILIFGIVAFLAWRASLETTLWRLREPMAMYPGAPVSRVVDPPIGFLREVGLYGPSSSIIEARDMDGDGAIELLVRQGARTVLLDFAPDGTWASRADIPAVCHAQSPTGWPDLQCGDEVYSLVAGRYIAVSQAGVVVWLQAADYIALMGSRKGPDGQVLPGGPGVGPGTSVVGLRIDGTALDKLGGFLFRRGVSDGVHAVICEGMHAGVPAQALVEDGSFVPLSFECGRDMELVAVVDGVPTRWRGKPLGVAVTPSGRKLVPDEFSKWMAGNEGGTFATPEDAAVLVGLRSDPVRATGMVKLEVAGSQGLGVGVAQRPLVKATRRLNADAEVFPMAERVSSATLLTEGTATLNTSHGCKLEVTVSDWDCVAVSGCLPGSTFLSVTESGCGRTQEVLRVGYALNVERAFTDRTELAVEMGASRSLWATRVNYARLLWREQPRER